ncbi:hypothetical protein ACIP5Y_07850 [Nocardia sp. NPDC088792]|uniref:hypothetical protein n=1 Tax=Nocardia sp. NPDC088792 TaxID=3364332 RepID=UPI00382CC002
MSAAVITASASILVAVLAYLLNQRGQVRQEHRRARLDRINAQLRELYGPLHAWLDVNEQIWEALRASHLPPKEERRPDADSASWRGWRDHALMPANRRMRDLIVQHADLILESATPAPLLTFCAHVSALEVAIETASPHDHALIGHPGNAYVSYVRDSFAALKTEQCRLLEAG